MQSSRDTPQEFSAFPQSFLPINPAIPSSTTAFLSFSWKSKQTTTLKLPEQSKAEFKVIHTEIKVSLRLSVKLLETYKKCNPLFNYDIRRNPKRVLTNPYEGVLNDGYDNENNDYILKVNDSILSINKNDNSLKEEYIIIDLLGKGTFGQVVKCLEKSTNKFCAIKVIKNKPAYFSQGKTEIKILRFLNQNENNNTASRIVKLLDFFAFRKHLFLAFELLDISLYDLLKISDFNGFPISDISSFAKQILEALIVAENSKIIHCDLKPENILFVSKTSQDLKVIDFGSSCFKNETPYIYIQSRFYRAPEVILGGKYSLGIDLWSLGCICSELYLGLPIFPGNSQYDQIKRIIDLLGQPSKEIIENSRFKNKYFNQKNDEFVMKSAQEHQADEKIILPPSKKYFSLTKIEDLGNYYNNSKYRDNPEAKQEFSNFSIFLDFLQKLLQLDPSERWTAKQAINHPFIKLYPKYFETPKNLQDFNENQETEEEEERELFQINKTMNQETRASSPPSKQDSIKQGSTALQKEESKEKKQPKSNKNHTRNWNSYTEFKVSNEFEDPPFLNQFAGCSLNQNDLNPSNNRKKSQEGQISGNKWLFGGPNDQKVQNIESIWQKPENNQYFQNVQNPNICQNAQKNTNMQNFQNVKTNFQNSQGLDQKADFQNSQIPDNLINAMNWQNIAYSQNSANFQNIVYPPNFQNMAYQQNPAFYQNMNYPPNQGYPQNPNFQNFENQFFENPHQAQRTSNIRDNQPQPLPNINLQDLFPNFQNQNYKNPQSNDLSFFLQQSMTSMQMQNQNQMYPPLNRSFSDPTNHQNFQTFQRNPNQMNPNFQYPPPFIDSNQNQSNLNLSYPHQLPNYNNPNQNFGSNAKFSEESKEKQGNFKSFVSKNRFPHPNYQVPNEIHEQEEDYGTPGVDIIPQFQNFGQKPVQSRFYSNQTQSEENKNPKKFKKKAKSEKGLFFQKNELDSSLDNASFIKNWNKEGGKKDDKAAPTKQYKHFEK